MDIQRPSKARAKRIRRIIYGTLALTLIVGVTVALSRLRPAAPTVDKGIVMIDKVKRGNLLREVSGLGTLVPEDIRWIPAQTDASVDRIVVWPGTMVKPDTIILELRNEKVRHDMVDAEFQLKAAQADLAQLRVQVNTDLMAQKSTAASARGEFETDRIQNELDSKEWKEGLVTETFYKVSTVKMQQAEIRAKLEEERVRIADDSAKAKIAAQQAKVDQQNAQYQLKKSDFDSLHVRAGINGVLQVIPVEVGAHVSPGTNLARVADPKKLMAQIKVTETQVKDVLPGQKAKIDTRNGIADGHVIRVHPSVENGTVTVDVAIDGALPDGSRPDLSVDGTIELENLKNVLYVTRPVHGQSGSTVGLFKLVDDGSEAVRVNVKLGRSSVNAIEVMQGLQVGDQIILSDMSNWDNVDRVRLR
jgi:HlyD family secretion protein